MVLFKPCVFTSIFETGDVNKKTVRDWIEQEITEVTPRQKGIVHMQCCSTYTVFKNNFDILKSNAT